MTSLVNARSFYYQEAAITWLFSSPEVGFYIEGYLTVVLRHKSDRWLAFVKTSFFLSPIDLSGILYRGVFFPRDLMVRIVSAEVLRRINTPVERGLGFHLRSYGEACIDAVIGRDIKPKNEWLN